MEKSDRDILGFSEDVELTHELIHKHYRKRSLVCHPDKNKSNAANQQFTLLTQAKDRLIEQTGSVFTLDISSSNRLDLELRKKVHEHSSGENNTPLSVGPIIEPAGGRN